jgi:hypothetical protein
MPVIRAELPDGGLILFDPDACEREYPIVSDQQRVQSLHYRPDEKPDEGRWILWERHWTHKVVRAGGFKVRDVWAPALGPRILIDGPCRVVTDKEARELLETAGFVPPQDRGDPVSPIEIGPLKINTLTRTISLYGKCETIDHPTAFALFLRIAQARGDLVSAKEIKAFPGCRWRHDLIVKKLPKWVQALIPAHNGRGGGRFFKLPQK